MGFPHRRRSSHPSTRPGRLWPTPRTRPTWTASSARLWTRPPAERRTSSPPTPELLWGTRSVGRATSGAGRWFEIKSRVHHKLVNSLTSEQLRDLNKESVRGEIGAVVERLILDEALPMTMGEREKLIE